MITIALRQLNKRAPSPTLAPPSPSPSPSSRRAAPRRAPTLSFTDTRPPVTARACPRTACCAHRSASALGHLPDCPMGVADMQAMLQTRLNIESRVGQLMGPPSYIYPNNTAPRLVLCSAHS